MARRATLAKLTRPRLHGAVPRERLFDRLDAARDGQPVVCVSGPPGAGKTTFVASWLDTRRVPAIWYQVDAGDCDLPTFFHYLGEAAVPFTRKHQARLPSFTLEYLDDVSGFSRRFFRELFSRLPAGGCLVLDNFQEFGFDDALHALISESIEEVPHGIVVIVISRRGPPGAFARLIAHERAALVAWDDLRLSLDEARAIGTDRLPISDAELVEIHRRSDGWAAGLMLMLEGWRRDKLAIDTAPVGREALFAYFTAQIFERVQDNVRQFLVITALLPQVPVSLARELTGEPRASDILEDLYHRHLFTHRREGLEPTYWYHSLFREFLDARAGSVLGAERVTALLSRGARLLEASGSDEDAFDLYRKASDWLSAARLVERRAEQLLSLGRSPTVRSWVEALPEWVLERRAWPRYWLGVALIASDPANARGHLERAFERFLELEDHLGQAVAAAGIIDAYVFEWSDFPALRRWVDVLGDRIGLLHLADKPVVEQRLVCSLLVGILYVAPGHTELRGCVDRVTAMLDEALPTDSKLAAAMMLLAYCNIASDPVRGSLAAACGTTLAARPDASPFARLWWHIRLGLHLFADGSAQEALASLNLAATIAKDHGFEKIAMPMCLLTNYRSVASFSLQDYRATQRHCARIIELAGTRKPIGRHFASHARVYLKWASGDIDGAAVLGAEETVLARQAGMAYLEVLARANHAVALAILRRTEELAAVLAAQRDLMSGTCFAHFEIEADLVEAWDLLANGNHEIGLARLRAAFVRSRLTQRRYVSLLRSSTVFAELLSAAVQNDIEVDHVADLVRTLKIAAPPEASDHWPWTIRVRTLGSFEVSLYGTPMRFSGKVPRKPLALLKAIIALGGHAVPMESLSDAMWPDESGDLSRKALDVTLARLRKLIGHPEALMVSEETVTLDSQSVFVDALQFLELTDVKSGRPDRQCLERAARLYGGEFLPSDKSAPWAARFRETLRSRFQRLVEVMASECERKHEWDAALDWYSRGIETDELAEAFYRGRMRVLRNVGRASEAIGTYRRLRLMLSMVLRVTPSAETQRLVREIQSSMESVDDL